MVYEFVAKIKDIKDDEVVFAGLPEEKMQEIDAKAETVLDVKISPPDDPPVTEVYVKVDISISSMPRFHDIELESTIRSFRVYAEEIAHMLRGKVSENDAFYHNSKTFWKLYT